MSPQEKEFSEIIESLVEQWGFRRHLGRVWSLLYLSEEALNPSQIEESLGLSKGNIHGILKELSKWGVVRKRRLDNDRNYYYEAEKHIWKSISNVFKARELRILGEAIERLQTLEGSIRDQKSQDQQEKIDKLQHIQQTVDTAYMLSSLLVNSDPEKLGKITKLVSKLRSL
ncbi:MAG: MarR family transcriptional regulator [Bdellovibrionota bacterium]